MSRETERLGPYRTPAPEPPAPSWWQRHRDDVLFTVVIAAALGGTGVGCRALTMHCSAVDEAKRAARVEEFRRRTEGCRLVERDHGRPGAAGHAVDATVTYGCPDGRRERFYIERAREAGVE